MNRIMDEKYKRDIPWRKMQHGNMTFEKVTLNGSLR